MEIHTYRARSLDEAQQMVRAEFGPDASIVHSREVQTGWWERVSRGRQFEIRTRQANRGPAEQPQGTEPMGQRIRQERSVPQSLSESITELRRQEASFESSSAPRTHQRNSAAGEVTHPSDDARQVASHEMHQPPQDHIAGAEPLRSQFESGIVPAAGRVPDEIDLASNLSSTTPWAGGAAFRERARSRMLEDEGAPLDTGDAAMQNRVTGVKASQTSSSPVHEPNSESSSNSPEGSSSPLLFELLSELVDLEVPEQTARELIEQLGRRGDAARGGLPAMRERLVRILAEDLATTGPINLAAGQQKVIALVGPTGVGKTTTIAKLAANLRLCERRRVGLITVDTFRVAAVDQLRTYAEIMDLPMEVVTTPREMRDALTRLSDEDVILIDTAGRSPQDAVQLQQLKSMLAEATPHEIQLVISCTASARHLQQVVDSFAPIGCTSILATKLDEVAALGNLVPLIGRAGLPFSYLTCGQNVPDDIVVAEKSIMLETLVGQQPIASLV